MSSKPSIRYVNGNWGKHDPPVLLRGSAFDPGDPPLLGFTNKDELRLVFDKETNMPPVSTRDQIDKLFEWSSQIQGIDYGCASQNCFSPGTNYVGKWDNSQNLVITILDSELVQGSDYIAEGNDGVVVTPEKQILIGNFKVVLKNAIRSMDLSSDPSTGTILVGGDWGTPVTELNFVQVFYLIALICSTIAIAFFIGKSIYIYTCKPKGE